MMGVFVWRTKLTAITMALICMEAESKFVTIKHSTQFVTKDGLTMMLLLHAATLGITTTTIMSCFDKWSLY